MNNGASETTRLTEGQTQQLQKLIGPYLVQLQQVENQANVIRTTINAVAGAYLAGLGLPSDLSVDLQTGHLSPVKAAD